MSRTKKFKIKEDDYIKAIKKADRELEIERHGKQIFMSMTKRHKSNKEYNRRDGKSVKFDED